MASLILDKAKDILSYYAKRFGPLPYPKLVIVEIGDEYQGGYCAPSLVLMSPHSMDLLPHEIAHQWWGTILAETIAEYSALLYAEGKQGQDTLGEGLKGPRRAAMEYTVVEPLSNNEPLGPYTHTLRWSKEMCVIHMLRHVLGDDLFFKGCRRIVEKYHNGRLALFLHPQAISINEFQESFEEVTGKSLKNFFDLWFRDIRIPKYSTEWYYTELEIQYLVTIKIHNRPASYAMMPIMIVTDKGIQRKKIQLNKTIVEESFTTQGKPIDVIFNFDLSFLGIEEKMITTIHKAVN